MSVESGRRSSPLLMTLPLLAVIAVAGLAWAKWWPYTLKLQTVLSDRSWAGTSILSSGGGTAGAAPSLAGGWDFTVAYGKAIWKALVVALLLAAAVETLVPRRRLMAALSGRGAYGGVLAGGLLSLPCMMCTCCTAPLARTLRRNGAPTSSVLAYWLGNPTQRSCLTHHSSLAPRATSYLGGSLRSLRRIRSVRRCSPSWRSWRPGSGSRSGCSPAPYWSSASRC
jgi:hypothetical protein